MKNKKVILPLILILAVTVVMTGCGNGDVTEDDVSSENSVQVNGTVAINRQGEGDQSGITVTAVGTEKSVTTDEDGAFSLNLEKGESYDLIATRDDLATTKIQDLTIDKDNPIDDINIMIQKPKISEYADEEDKNAPEINVEGLKNFAKLNRKETVDIVSDKGISQYFVDLNNNYGSSYEDLKNEITIPNKEFPIYNGGGLQKVVVAVVDQNNNITQKIYQMKMPETEEGVILKPDAIDFIGVTSETYNTSINLLDHPEVGLNTMPEDTMLINFIDWASVNAYSYNVYRSFDGENYELVDTVNGNSFVDISSSLEVGKKVWYKVAGVNEAGEGGSSASVYVKPLPVYELSLEGPEGPDTSLTPDLKWSSNDLNVEDLEYEYEFKVKDTNETYEDPPPFEYPYANEDKTEVNSVNVKEDLGFTLDRGTRYEWTIQFAEASKTYIDENGIYSEATTFGANADYGLYPENSSMTFETRK